MSSGISRGRWKKSHSVWLAVAMAAHASLLLLPIKRPDLQPTVQAIMAIHLAPFSPAAVPVYPPQTQVPPVTANAVDKPSTTAPQFAPAEWVSAKPTQSPGEQTDEEPAWEKLTTAHLLQTSRTIRLNHAPHSATRQLGIHIPHKLPFNWLPGAGAGALQPGANLFSGMSVPAQVKIVDRWLAADGSHRVVLNLPNGQTLCGRAEPWNPLQPLVEHIMSFGTCGGGGKRTFSMSARAAASRAPSIWTGAIE